MKRIFKLLFGLILMIPIFVFASDITLNTQKVVLNPGQAGTFVIDATNVAGKIDISSSNTSVVRIDTNPASIWVDGLPQSTQTTYTINITGVNSGSANITLAIDAATLEEEELKTTKTVQVVVRNKVTFAVDNQNYYSYFEPGDTITFKTDVSKEGYELEGYRYNNRLYKLNETLTMPSSDITLTAQWKPVTPEIPASTGYVVDNDYIRNIEAFKVANTLNLALNSVYTVRVVNSNNVVKTTDYIATGDKVQIYLNSTKLSEYSVIIKGDINGDGKISSLDYVMIKLHIMGDQLITDTLKRDAADMDSNNAIVPLDYVKVRNYIMNM